MPYDTTSELPDSVKDKYSKRCQKVFMEAFNADFKRNKREGRAMAVGHTAAQNCEKNT